MRPRLQPRRAPPLLCALAATLLAGCGSSSSTGNGLASKTPTQIVAAAKAAALGAATAHVKGSIVSGGKPISLDMELVAGKGGKGRIALEGVSVELIGVDKAVFVKGSSAFYRRVAGGEAARKLEGKWLKTAAKTGAFASLASLTNLGELTGSTLAAHGALSRGGTTTIDGRAAVAVTDASNGGTLYVAATGTPYPLEIVDRGAGAGKIVFDRWNQPVVLEPPGSSVYVNKLQRGR
jgi:hypothetical protein